MEANSHFTKQKTISGAMPSISAAMCFKFLYSQLSVCSLLCLVRPSALNGETDFP